MNKILVFCLLSSCLFGATLNDLGDCKDIPDYLYEGQAYQITTRSLLHGYYLGWDLTLANGNIAEANMCSHHYLWAFEYDASLPSSNTEDDLSSLQVSAWL